MIERLWVDPGQNHNLEAVKASAPNPIQKTTQEEIKQDSNDEARPFEMNMGMSRQASNTEALPKKPAVYIFQQNTDAANKAKEEMAKNKPPPPMKLVSPFLEGQEPEIQKPVQPIIQKKVTLAATFAPKRDSSCSSDDTQKFSLASKSEVVASLTQISSIRQKELPRFGLKI